MILIARTLPWQGMTFQFSIIFVISQSMHFERFALGRRIGGDGSFCRQCRPFGNAMALDVPFGNHSQQMPTIESDFPFDR
jgi:hypothetical protein